ncbi:hypothetical protein BBK36DRAFT_1114568 [Trichoderma citrinoviride]|uniref:Uncharacterized protein n=1 Tax=Trichoderma citrinoviride TaxID=58853 RepID=A0A2T4BFM4_9HYPO|nr:hypothetical protein BBK36DRAFT_1114568 [Trichoderma citrinoviride]PTB68009.1 hypothetical protein BBK36DRAFT_1114568 [Trichoderma citrinoviride]
MTSRRPSLLQARGGPHAHAHAHSSYKLGHGHGHDQHLHQQYPHDAVAGPRPNDVKPESAQAPELHDRAVVPVVDQPSTDVVTPSATSLVTRVVQTVSLVQIVDSSGSPIETQTRFAIPNTVVVDKDTGKTISASNPDHTPAPAAPGSGPESSEVIRSSTSSISIQSPAASVSSSSQAPAASIPTISISPTTPASLSPSAHSSPPPTPAAPSLGVGHNGTNIHHSAHHNSTNTLFHAESINATHSSTKHSSTKTHSHTSFTTTEFSTSEATSFSETVLSTVSSFEPLATDAAFGGVFGSDGASPTTTSSEATPSASSNGTDTLLSPQQKQVIGGVVGGLAGAAFFLVLVLLALRYKRRQLNAAQAAGQPTSEGRGLPPTIVTPDGAPSGGSGGSGGAMTERYGAAAVPAAFAGLASKSSSASANSAETGEKSFYRVSGRKLPSVLQVGGDGYSDPRSSFMSSTSDYYRGSQAFDPVGGAGARLQLGVPMRPDSGVPIVRSGPARAVVAEPNPFADPPKTPPADASSPPLTRLRESPSRGSRFQEGI